MILHCFNKDDVTVALREYHDVLIVLARYFWEPTRLVRPNFLSGFISQVEYAIGDCLLLFHRAQR